MSFSIYNTTVKESVNETLLLTSETGGGSGSLSNLSITFGSLTPPLFGSGSAPPDQQYTFQFVSDTAVMYIPNAADNATWVAAVTEPNVYWTGTVVNLP